MKGDNSPLSQPPNPENKNVAPGPQVKLACLLLPNAPFPISKADPAQPSQGCGEHKGVQALVADTPESLPGCIRLLPRSPDSITALSLKPTLLRLHTRPDPRACSTMGDCPSVIITTAEFSSGILLWKSPHGPHDLRTEPLKVRSKAAHMIGWYNTATENAKELQIVPGKSMFIL